MLLMNQRKQIASNPDAHELAARYECALQEYGDMAWGEGRNTPRTAKGYMPKASIVKECDCEMFWSRRPANHQADNKHLRLKYKVHLEVLRAIAWLALRNRKSSTNPTFQPPIEVLVNVALDLHTAANLGIWKSAWADNPDGTKGAALIYQLYHQRMEEYCERTGTTIEEPVSSGINYMV